MGAKASSTAGTVAKRAFPTAHRAAAEVVHKRSGGLDVSRDLPNHLRAAAAAAASGNTDLSIPNVDELTETKPSKFDGPLDLDYLSTIVEPGLTEGGTRAETLASSKQASYVEELRNRHVAEMKTKSDPALEMAKMMGEIGPITTRQELLAHQRGEEGEKGRMVKRTNILTDGFIQLRTILYEADDIAEREGNRRRLPLQLASNEIAIKHSIDVEDVETILRMHAVPSFVNENTQQCGRKDMNDESSHYEKRWKGYWPHQVSSA
jgi:hypothetical protein